MIEVSACACAWNSYRIKSNNTIREHAWPRKDRGSNGNMMMKRSSGNHTPWIQRARDYQVGFQPSMGPPPPASVSLSSSHHSSNLSRSSHRSSHTHSRSRRCTYHSVGACPTQDSSNAQREGSEKRGEEMEMEDNMTQHNISMLHSFYGNVAKTAGPEWAQFHIHYSAFVWCQRIIISIAIQAMAVMLKALHCGSHVKPLLSQMTPTSHVGTYPVRIKNPRVILKVHLQDLPLWRWQESPNHTMPLHKKTLLHPLVTSAPSPMLADASSVKRSCWRWWSLDSHMIRYPYASSANSTFLYGRD